MNPFGRIVRRVARPGCGNHPIVDPIGLARGVEAPEFAELLTEPGPFLSLFLPTEGNVQDAPQRALTQWRNARTALDRLGVPADLLDRVEAIVPDAHRSGDCLGVIANADRVLHVEHGPPVGSAVEARWGPAPHLLPMLAWRQSEPAAVVVLTDRTGADLYAFHRRGPELLGGVEGDHDELRKVAPGGWSQRRYQQRAEDSWAGNAKEVADALRRLVDDVEPELIVLAGDVRAVQLLQEALPEKVEALVHVVTKEWPRDRGPRAIPDDVAAMVRDRVRDSTGELLGRFAEERGQHGRAVEGIDATARALTRARVGVLLIADERDDDRSLWFGPDATAIGRNAREVSDLGVPGPLEGPARDVLVRAALGTGARIRVFEPGLPAPDPTLEPNAESAPTPAERSMLPRDGVGGLLRWSE
jgi:hypothetical protein